MDYACSLFTVDHFCFMLKVISASHPVAIRSSPLCVGPCAAFMVPAHLAMKAKKRDLPPPSKLSPFSGTAATTAAAAAAAMAAFRRVAALAGKVNLLAAARYEQVGGQAAGGGRTRRGLAVGTCLATGGAVALYFYRDTTSRAGSKRMERRRVTGPLPTIPSVEAKEKESPFDFEDGDVYMSSHEHRFRIFSSVEYEGQLYMTPQNFIESVTMSEPRNKRPWRSLAKQELEKILSETPLVWRGSSKLFRNLRERGIISYTEYLFLLCILTKPHAGFKIAFNMFDADGNQMVDKREFLVLQEIFRKKNEKKGRKGDVEKSAQLSMQLYGYQVAPMNSVLKKDSQEFVARSYWDVLRRSASQVLFSDLAERADESITIDTTLLVHFFGKKGKAELTFDDFYRFMDNLQTEVLEIEFLTYSKGMTTISEEDFAKILLRFTNVENISAYLENVRHCIPDEKKQEGITFDEFRSFFQFLNNLEDFAIAMQMYNFASRSIGQDEFARAVYVATGLKLTRHLVNTIFKIFDVDHDDQLSYKEFIGIMKDRLHRGGRGYKSAERATSFKSCLKKELAGSR
uniref:EF-hand domain-containing protein n=1 Tax=Gasterosteus aculeatus aculeatus TaxID=481459 RepID=A0AAQ4Q5Y3_GASAC|nr:calcium uptake protein 3, mitochondrial isoform X4 [Gasterosteus aculeatus aculeatus]